MDKILTLGTQIKCSKSKLPSMLISGNTKFNIKNKPVCTKSNYKFPIDIPGFILCTSKSNPNPYIPWTPFKVCVPVITSSWTKSSKKTFVSNENVITEASELKCKFDGKITVSKVVQNIANTN